MTQPPPDGQQGEPDGGYPPYGQNPYGQAPYPPPPGQPPYGPPPGYGPAPGFPVGGYGAGGYGANPAAPWGIHPITGEPYSDKSKLVAGLLQIFVPLGIGRFYMGYTGMGVAQLLVTIFTCGVGALWPFIDGIVILAGTPRDTQGRPLRDST